MAQTLPPGVGGIVTGPGVVQGETTAADERTREAPSDPSAWPRVVIEDPYTRHAARRALTGALEWLARPQCQSVLSEFQDLRGKPLGEKLGDLGVTAERYLGMIQFRDAGERGMCATQGILAVTTPGSRLVHLCGRDFERAWRRGASAATVTMIHEMLHSLGLGENPPSPIYISHRIQQLCEP